MRFLRESALDKVRAGLTTLKEINKVTFIESDAIDLGQRFSRSFGVPVRLLQFSVS